MINHVGKMCVTAIGLCMMVLIATRKRDGRYYFGLWQANNTQNNDKLLLSESAVSCL
jgi:hypothetical protein